MKPGIMMSETYSSSAHPPYREMISAAVKAHKRRIGSSRQEILKYITSYYNLGENLTLVRYLLKLALKAGVQDGSLKQTKGTGANGSFRLGKTAKQNNKAKTFQATKSTAAKKLPVASKTLNGHQKILPQQVRPVALYFVKSREFDFKVQVADLQSIKLPKNSPPDAPIPKRDLPDNGTIHNEHIKNIDSPKTFTTPDSPIQKGDLPDNSKIHNVSKTPDALQDIEPPNTNNENAEVSKINVRSPPKKLPSKKPRYLKVKQKVVSKPLIKTTHPIIPDSTANRRNCKLCYSKLRREVKCRSRCYTCETYLCFSVNRNCLLEFHKK